MSSLMQCVTNCAGSHKSTGTASSLWMKAMAKQHRLVSGRNECGCKWQQGRFLLTGLLY